MMHKYFIWFLFLTSCGENLSSEIYGLIDDGDVGKIEKLIDNGFDVNKKYYDGWTPLTIAVGKGNEKIVRFLIKKGADVNLLEGGGNSPLFWAAFYGNKDMVELLLANKADPCVFGNGNIKPKEIAKINNFIEVEKIIPKCNPE